MATILFTYSLQWDGDRTPHRRGSGLGMEGQPISFEVELPPQAFDKDTMGAATVLWSLEYEFLRTVAAQYPEHHLVKWESRLGSTTGPQLSSFRCGFTASE